MVDAGFIGRALGGRKIGAGWSARCPAHNDRTPSLSIRDADDGKVLVRCHAGCDQNAVIAALRLRGLWPDADRRSPRQPTRHAVPEYETTRNRADRSQAALSIWRGSRPAKGTLVEIYLRSRGLNLPTTPSIRFHAGLKHPSGGVWPVMVAFVTHGVDGAPVGIHRTFLVRNGSGKAPVEPAKMMLGRCRGGAVRLADPGDVLMIAEGIETALSAMQATGHPAWAALSTSGLRSLDLPRDVRNVIVLADGDDPGEAAARACAGRWTREGRLVRIARPPTGLDFNDVLLAKVGQVQRPTP